MMHRVRTMVLAVSAAALSGAAAAEDLTIVSTVSVGKGAPATATQYISGSGRVRTSNAESDTIFDATTGHVAVINHKKKEYFEFTREEMAQAMQGFEQQMQQAGPLMEKMMGGAVGEVTVKKTGPAEP